MINYKFRKITYETFDYYSVKPKDFNELLNKDKKLLEPLLKNKFLYAFVSVEFFIDDMGLWEFYFLPNDDPEEFKYEIHFKNPISEHKIILNKEEKRIVRYGISKIDLDFYLENYDFFNSPQTSFLIISDDDNIKLIDEYLNNKIFDLYHKKNYYLSKHQIHLMFQELDLINLNCDSIFIAVEDDGEFKNIVLASLEFVIKEDMFAEGDMRSNVKIYRKSFIEFIKVDDEYIINCNKDGLKSFIKVLKTLKSKKYGFIHLSDVHINECFVYDSDYFFDYPSLSLDIYKLKPNYNDFLSEYLGVGDHFGLELFLSKSSIDCLIKELKHLLKQKEESLLFTFSDLLNSSIKFNLSNFLPKRK